MNIFVALAGICLLIALIFLLISWRRQARSGIPAGRIIYVDTQKWGKIEQPLFDPELRLVGKPDYLVESSDGLLPVEVKSSRSVEAPYNSHVYQLAVYCRLVEAVYHQRPRYGILKYPHKTFAIDYTKDLEHSLMDLIAKIRKDQTKMDQKNMEMERSHESVSRCKNCSYKEICPQALL